MTQETFEQLRFINTDKIAWALADNLRGCRSEYGVSSFAAAYVLLMVFRDNSIDMTTPKSFIESSQIDYQKGLFLKNALSDCWNSVVSLMNQFNSDTLMAYMLFNEAYNSKTNADYTPVGIAHLAAKLMEVSDYDSIADFGTGRGAFTRECFSFAPNASYYSNDINTEAINIAALRAELLGTNVITKQENIFNMNLEDLSFDKVFSNYPFGLRTRDVGFERNNAIRILLKRFSSINKSISSDWLFNAILINSINETGKAVGVMTNGSTWNTLDKDVRKYFIENGYVEAVISLPEKIFENTSIPTTMILMSHGNKTVMMVDARDLCEKGRRTNVISEIHINKILEYCANESEYSKRLTMKQLANNDYILNPIRYMENVIAIENGIPFDSIIKNITRGAQLSAAQLDTLVSNEQTDFRYLMLGNIRDGIIDENLPYLSNIDSRQYKYCLKNHSLILSKNGYPFKVAVATIKAGEPILANGNLYVIELNEEKADPYFIKAFLESDKGIAALRSISVGSAVPNIGVDQLRKMLVPFVPLEKQHEIANKYLATLDEISLLKKKIVKATNSLSHIFDLCEEV